MIAKINKTKLIVKHPKLGKGVFVKYDIPDGFVLSKHKLDDVILFYKGKQVRDGYSRLPRRKYDGSLLKDCKIIKDISRSVNRFLTKSSNFD